MKKKCFRHPRRKAEFNWRICSDGQMRDVCRACDLELNKMGLRWAFPKNWREMLAAYRASVEAQER